MGMIIYFMVMIHKSEYPYFMKRHCTRVTTLCSRCGAVAGWARHMVLCDAPFHFLAISLTTCSAHSRLAVLCSALCCYLKGKTSALSFRVICYLGSRAGPGDITACVMSGVAPTPSCSSWSSFSLFYPPSPTTPPSPPPPLFRILHLLFRIPPLPSYSYPIPPPIFSISSIFFLILLSLLSSIFNHSRFLEFNFLSFFLPLNFFPSRFPIFIHDL